MHFSNMTPSLNQIFAMCCGMKTEARRFMTESGFHKEFGCVDNEKRISSVAKYFQWTLELKKSNAVAKELIEIGTLSFFWGTILKMRLRNIISPFCLLRRMVKSWDLLM